MRDIVEKLRKNYSFQINNIFKNEDSTDGNVYMIISNDTKYIMKLYDDENHAMSMVNLCNDLKANGMNVPEIILNKNNQRYTIIDENYVVLYSFLSGKEIGSLFKNINSEISIMIAREIKKFHKICSGDNKHALDEIPFCINKVFTRYSALHFDLTNCNIFYNEEWDSKIGFIDFDDAKYGPTVFDVAIAISLLYFSKSRGVNMDGLKVFLSEYYDDEKLRKEEVPHLKECAIKWIDYIINNNNFDSSTKESFIIRKNLIENNLTFEI